MENYVGIVAIAAAVGAALCSPLACSSKSSSGFVPDDDSGAGSSSGASSSGASGGSSGTSSSSGSGSSGTSSGFSQGDSGGGMGTGNCKTGTYSGTFSCNFVYDPDASGTPIGGGTDAGVIMLTGNLSFQLAQSVSGEIGQDTASGTFMLNAGITTGMATLSGTLDCNSGRFTGALTGGMYTLLFFSGPFEGPLTSDYNGTSFSFVNGLWSLSVPGEGYCPGTWTAAYTGDQ